ncbi:expressed unknown protein [Seminavis robusta]|uniref:Uncharacterized protein n=1 Tax=Seminavis robusta TaxID=568900 RepID=A0A9N8E2R6_9STRA|nr:expressed unknown protein [Seminavis robusta]|eukprot:Sro591_g172030.1 n/a (565) ;mRNA; r:32857-34551
MTTTKQSKRTMARCTVALFLLACHQTYVFRNTASSTVTRALATDHTRRDNKHNATTTHNVQQPTEPPASWTGRVLGPSSTSTSTKQQEDEDDGGIARGILSHKPQSFFQAFQDKIDHANLEERCQRYGFSMHPPSTTQKHNQSYNHNHTNVTQPAAQRRIFYGSLIADENWELLDIVATEAYQVFAGVVFVESNRTQTFTQRPFLRDHAHADKLKALFGTSQLQIRQYVNEDSKLLHLEREHAQRQEILHGWKEMGMTPNDIGYLGDVDETFSRDFLRAVQQCPYVKPLDYKSHHCDNRQTKMSGFTRVFETSPECVVKDRAWFHPDMVIGACIEGIGNETRNPIAPRVNGYWRALGYASGCNQEDFDDRVLQGDRFPLYNAADFRMTCGGRMYEMNAPNHTRYSAFHLHNFFADFEVTRNKYLTFGHPRADAMTAPLEDLHTADLRLMVRCVRNQTDAPDDDQKEDHQMFARELGGVEGVLPPFPIYFMDKDYRDRKHRAIQAQVEQDEQRRRERLNLSQLERKIEDVSHQFKEARRFMWSKEAEMGNLRKRLRESEKPKDKK